MNTFSTLLLTGGLLAFAPAIAAAQPGKLLVFKVTSGQMHLTVDAPPTKDDVDVITPVTTGCVEIQPGPANVDIGTPFVLTRLSLHFADFTVVANDTLEKPMLLRQVAAQLRDAVTWRGMPVPNANNLWLIEIAHDAGHGVGEPTFVLGATVDPEYFIGDHNEDVPPLWQGAERASEKVVGTIDLQQGKLEATAAFTHETDILPGLDVTRTITVELQGELVTTQSGGCRAVWTGGSPDWKAGLSRRGR